MKKFYESLVAILLLSACSPGEGVDVPEPLTHPDKGEYSSNSGDSTVDGDDSSTTGGINTGGDDSTGAESGDNGTNPDGSSSENLPEPVALPAFFSGAHEAAGELASFYLRDNGLWPEGWLSTANSLVAMIGYMERTGTQDFSWILANTLVKVGADKLYRESQEDNASWGIAWLRAYDLTKEAKYLDAARVQADRMTREAWDETCGGGIYDRTDKTSKSVAANLLYIKLLAGLSTRVMTASNYKADAVKAWEWFQASALLKDRSLVLGTIEASTCQFKETSPLAQNQGTLVGALTELYRATSNEAYLSKAKLLADASMKALAHNNGVFSDDAFPKCDNCSIGDRLNKGIYVRNLAELNAVAKVSTISKFLEMNSRSIWSKAKGQGGMFGYRWDGSFDAADSARQTSAVDLLNSQISAPLARNYGLLMDTRTSAVCTNNEAAIKAFDGSAATKWCGIMIDGINHLSVDLGADRVVTAVRILHAGAGGESRAFNTKDFELQISSDGANFTEIGRVRGNLSSMSYTKVSGTGRFLRLRFTSPGADNFGRIYEMSSE
ncbi:MAG: hypothetical protein EOP07_00900 [Proteobacteria bacterium]|nr:MAG: hypothetical protein EOP07_00900 [Pseudomonadota bacterium]